MTTPETDPEQSNYWLEIVAHKILDQFEDSEGDIIVSSGHSPSGNYHLGTLREILTASAITYQINTILGQGVGKVARHIDFVDDLDALRKIPVNVDASWSQYIGHPLSQVPDPFDCASEHQTYGAHFIADLDDALGQMGVHPERVYAHDAYPAGTFTGAIEASLERLGEVRAIIEEVSKRRLDEGWSPVQVLSDNGSLREWRYTGWDKARQIVTYEDASGATGEVSYTAGRVKLDWRLDWPARWNIWGVRAEPFGRDHASKGGSYDTGQQIVERIFGGNAPVPIPYEFINRVGQTKKMSKSTGDVITASGALKIMPAEILRFFILRSQPSRTLIFDEGIGLYNLIDEYAATEQAVAASEPSAFAEAYRVASAQTEHKTISKVPFGHLVQVYQAAQGKIDAIGELLRRTDYADVASDPAQMAIVATECAYIAAWLADYAPESVKFAIQSTLPEVELSEAQRAFLTQLADAIADAGPLEAQAMHEAIYAASVAAEIKPGEAFKTLYRVILNREAGPRAGWFLASLDRTFLVDRLRFKA